MGKMIILSRNAGYPLFTLVNQVQIEVIKLYNWFAAREEYKRGQKSNGQHLAVIADYRRVGSTQQMGTS